ncbi:MAG: hypothetical protein VB914_05685 [Porticoccaceae bacterium]
MDEEKRIEVNEKIGPLRLRASRTGGISASTSPSKGITLNTQHGARVSKTFKGLTLGLQNSRSVFRGRWSAGGMNINLSKSGFSFSARNPFGTVNLTNPKRSSGRIMGIQVRGSAGLFIASMGALIYCGYLAIKTAALIVARSIPIILWGMQIVWSVIMLLVSLLIFTVIDLPRQLLSKISN